MAWTLSLCIRCSNPYPPPYPITYCCVFTRDSFSCNHLHIWATVYTTLSLSLAFVPLHVYSTQTQINWHFSARWHWWCRPRLIPHQDPGVMKCYASERQAETNVPWYANSCRGENKQTEETDKKEINGAKSEVVNEGTIYEVWSNTLWCERRLQLAVE